jgi:Domain of unknown function (DUF4145)/Resolvase, N terminal domain
MIYGYARVSTDGQSVDVQVKQWRGAGAEKVYRETASGAKTARTQLHRALAQLAKGDFEREVIRAHERRPRARQSERREDGPQTEAHRAPEARSDHAPRPRRGDSCRDWSQLRNFSFKYIEVVIQLMSLLIADCPRCGAKSITFDVRAEVFRGQMHGWMDWYEVFSVCRNCHAPTIFLIKMSVGSDPNRLSKFKDPNAIVEYKSALNDLFEVDRYISYLDHAHHRPPEFLEEDISNAFKEGAACFCIACYNAAATMFRLCVDLVTRRLLPDLSNTAAKQPNEKTRRDLGLRLQWMFENNLIDPALRELAKCIREDANDSAHIGSLSKEDAEDLLDFTYTLLERLVTEPKRLERAEARRKERRRPPSS